MRASGPKSDSTRLILGLCNPGEEYKHTYHNVGGLFIDYLISLSGIDLKKTRYFEYGKSGRLILAKSLVYMNESGVAAVGAVKYLKLSAEQLIVAHDDSDLTIGSFKITTGQSAAGHHGIESLISSLDTKDFSRIRIGVRPKQEKERKKAGDFVLKKINRTDSEILKGVFSEICLELDSKFLLGISERN